jgi:hypothetical protein
VKAAPKRWLSVASLYTVAGLVASAIVGTVLGLLGWLTNALIPFFHLVIGYMIVTLSTAYLLREVNILNVPFPQTKRQTADFLASRLGMHLTALMWGFDLGLFFTTRMTLSATWVLACVLVWQGRPDVAIAAMTAYWLGRALSVWAGPWLLGRESGITCVLEIDRQMRYFPVLNVLVLVALIVQAMANLIH